MGNNALDRAAAGAIPTSAKAVRLLNDALSELDRLGAVAAAAHVSHALALIGKPETASQG